MEISINGSKFTTTKTVDMSNPGAAVWLNGKRGGMHSLIRNTRSGRLVFLRNGLREEAIVAIEGVAL